MKKKNQPFIITLVAVTALLVGGITGYAIAKSQVPAVNATSVTDITSFQECADAGYAIQQTYPEMCSVPGGQSFTNN